MTDEEREYLEQIDKLDNSYYEISESAHIAKHRSIIDRLEAKVKELERENSNLVNEGGMQHLEIVLLNGNLSSLIEAAEPIVNYLHVASLLDGGSRKYDSDTIWAHDPFSGKSTMVSQGDIRRLNEAVRKAKGEKG